MVTELCSKWPRHPESKRVFSDASLDLWLESAHLSPNALMRALVANLTAQLGATVYTTSGEGGTPVLCEIVAFARATHAKSDRGVV
jgi:hypothetical protein